MKKKRERERATLRYTNFDTIVFRMHFMYMYVWVGVCVHLNKNCVHSMCIHVRVCVRLVIHCSLQEDCSLHCSASVVPQKHSVCLKELRTYMPL